MEKFTKVIPILKDDIDIPIAFRSLLWVDMRDGVDQGLSDIIRALTGYRVEKSLDISWHVLPRSVGGLTEAATRVAGVLLQANDPDSDIVRGLGGEILADTLEMTPQDVNSAIRELRERGLVKTFIETGFDPFEFANVEPTYLLYFRFADYFDYDPTDDLKSVVSAILKLKEADGETLHEQLGLSYGRLNRAVDYIREYGIADVVQYLGTSPYTFGLVRATRRTRIFMSEDQEQLF